MSEITTNSEKRKRVPFARAVRPKTIGETDAFTQALTFCLGPVLFGLFGRFLDDRLGTTPWLLVVGIIAGFAGSSATLYYRYEARVAELEADKPWNRPAEAKPAAPDTGTDEREDVAS